MADRLEEFLRGVARELGAGGVRCYAPAEWQTLEEFQADVRRIYGYAGAGLLDIPAEPRRAGTGERVVDRIMVSLTQEGADTWGDGS